MKIIKTLTFKFNPFINFVRFLNLRIHLFFYIISTMYVNVHCHRDQRRFNGDGRTKTSAWYVQQEGASRIQTIAHDAWAFRDLVQHRRQVAKEHSGKSTKEIQKIVETLRNRCCVVKARHLGLKDTLSHIQSINLASLTTVRRMSTECLTRLSNEVNSRHQAQLRGSS